MYQDNLFNNYSNCRALLVAVVEVTILYRRNRIGRDGHFDQSDAYGNKGPMVINKRF